jgi:hypothetical protein
MRRSCLHTRFLVAIGSKKSSDASACGVSWIVLDGGCDEHRYTYRVFLQVLLVRLNVLRVRHLFSTLPKSRSVWSNKKTQDLRRNLKLKEDSAGEKLVERVHAADGATRGGCRCGPRWQRSTRPCWSPALCARQCWRTPQRCCVRASSSAPLRIPVSQGHFARSG